MDELERWLRATMQSATQDPPVNLLAGVWRRRRSHLRRVGVSCVAVMAAVAVAVPSVLHAVRPGGSARARGEAAATTARPTAAPGTVLLRCGSYSDQAITGGELYSRWQADSIHAGPVWFVDARTGVWASSRRMAGGKLAAVAPIILAVRNGSTVEITTAAPQRSRFRFLEHSAVSGQYTPRDGVGGLTLVACPWYPVGSRIPAAYAAGLTLFYLPLGYITNLTGCVSLQVASPPSWHARWTGRVPLAGDTCKSRS